jgi:predicted 2-oxoglutarate/Fe(II)-dependent dioxygenase YbiX
MSESSPSLAQALADTLGSVQRPGTFQVSGTFDIHPPRLEVDGVGPISLPLLPTQAEALVAIAEQAPYGRGTETLVDRAVRRTWQVDASRVQIRGKRWSDDLALVLERVRTGLAVAAPIEAELYKLLVYDTGSFFVAHRDTEKAPGMFATLVLVLPCDYSGGELIVRHRGEEVRIDLHRDEPSEAAFAAFFADCVHEVLPIASGHRLALIYNLVRRGEGPLPEPPDYGPQRTALATMLKDWGRAGQPTKLVYPLEHAYTEAALGFDALKGQDAAAAQVLSQAAHEARCDIHLALLTVSESGWAEYTGGGRWEEPELAIGEVETTDRRLHDWRRPDGVAPGLGALPFEADELSPPDALADIDDTEPDFSEATGNAGASFERLYQRAALVLWPSARRAQALVQGGVDASVPALLDLVRRWESLGAPPEHELRDQALDLAAAIREAWPREAWMRHRASEDKRPLGLFAAELRLGDLEGCAAFIAECSAAGAYGPADNPALTLVLGHLPAPRAADLLSQVIRANVARLPGACAELLARCAAVDGRAEGDCEPDSERSTDPGIARARIDALRVPAKALVDGLPGARSPVAVAPPLVASPGPVPLTPEHLADALIGLARIDSTIAERAVDLCLAHPAHYGLDRLVVPAALLLRERMPDPQPPAMARLRLAVLERIEARIALPLAPPADWTRDARLPCSCADCRELARFLASPTERSWQFRGAEGRRRHLAQTVASAESDLTLTTEKRGSPHTLVCTKSQASYERLARQRAQDLTQRARLAGT